MLQSDVRESDAELLIFLDAGSSWTRMAEHRLPALSG